MTVINVDQNDVTRNLNIAKFCKNQKHEKMVLNKIEEEVDEIDELCTQMCSLASTICIVGALILIPVLLYVQFLIALG